VNVLRYYELLVDIHCASPQPSEGVSADEKNICMGDIL